MSVLENVGVVKPTVTSYLWEVKNFCIACKNAKNTGDRLQSPTFPTRSSTSEDKWCLWLYPKGYDGQYKDYVSLFLEYLGEANVDLNVHLSILDDKYCKVLTKQFTRQFQANSDPFGFFEVAKQDFINNRKNKIIVNDTLCILCEIIYDKKVAVPFQNQLMKDDFPEYYRIKEFDEFEKLFNKEDSADVSFRIGTDEIKVHKVIIMSRSQVFQAMFEHDMKEKEHNIVEITDIKYGVMKEVFRFMYVGKVNGIEKIASELLVAAEKYSLEGLKVLCEKQLFNDLNVNNVIEYLKLADIHNAVDLKSKIIKYITCNQEDIIHKQEFKSLSIEIECEVLRAIVGIDNTIQK